MRRYHNVILYTSESKMSELTKEYFRENNIDFDERSITWHKKYADELKEKMGTLNTPVADIDGRIVEGYQPAVFNMIFFEKEKKVDESLFYSGIDEAPQNPN